MKYLLGLVLAITLTGCLAINMNNLKNQELDNIWAILKISYNPVTIEAQGGTCGTVFFINNKYFISANHCFDNQIFNPNPGFPKVKLCLANEKGDIIESINFRIKKSIPDYDLAIGELINTDKNIVGCSIGEDCVAGDDVYNIGFPTDDKLVNYKLRIENDELVIENLNLRKSKQEGKVSKLVMSTVNANDIKLKDKLLIQLNYTSTVGFSGGPLISKSTGKIVGLMSLVVPKEIDVNQPAMAIRISDILPFIENK